MAYTARINGEVFFDTNSIDMALGLTSAFLTLKAGAAGEFSFKVPHRNKYYNHFNLLTDYIDVYRDEDLIFSGRVASIDMDFDGTMSISAEGLLTILNDTIFRPTLHEGNLHALVTKIIQSHNSQVETSKRISIKSITITDVPCYRDYENYESSYSRLEDLVDSFGGYLSIRKENGVLGLYWEEITLLSDQTIDFGENLLSIDKESNTEDLITVLIPLGAQIEDENTGERSRLTIASVNSGLDYIELPNTTEKVVGVEVWDDVEVASNLLRKGQEFLNEQSQLKTTINVTAVDLADTGLDIEHFKVGKKIKVTSIPHGLEEQEFECLDQKLNLLSPADNTLTLGTVENSFTVRANRQALLNTKLIERIIGNYVTNARLNNVKTDVEQQVQENYTLIEQNSEAISLIGRQVEAIAKIFYEEPVPPYAKGDLWYRGVSYDKGSAVPYFAIPGYAIPDVGGDLFICTVDKALGEDFDMDDWKPTFSSQFKDINNGMNSLIARATSAEIEINAAKALISLNAEAIDYNKQEIRSAGIRIDALNTSMNLKVDKTNYNAAEIALMINNAGSTIKIEADHISLEGVVTANNNFKIKLDGSIEATNGSFSGKVDITNGGSIGGFVIDATSIHTNGVAITSNATNSVGLSSSTFTRTINGTSRGSLKFAIGSNFAVNNTGVLYANSAILQNASIVGGSIEINTSSKSYDSILLKFESTNGSLTGITSSQQSPAMFQLQDYAYQNGSLLTYTYSGLLGSGYSAYDYDSSKGGRYETGYSAGGFRVSFRSPAPSTIHGSTSGTVYDHIRFYSTLGTTSATGTSVLYIGNNTASGTKYNQEGRILLYGKNSYYTYLIPNQSLTANRTVYFPDGTGTLMYSSSSSKRYKKYIKPITAKDLDPHKLLDLNVVQFKYRKKANLQYPDMEDLLIPGIIAEDVAKKYPSAVIHNADGSIESWDERRIIPGMLSLIQEMYKDLQEIKHGSI